MSKVEWNQSQVMDEMTKKVRRNTVDASSFLAEKVQELISTGQAVGRTRTGRLKGLNPSKPGDPPKVLTGTLRRNVTFRLVERGSEIVGQVGIAKGPASKYARRLEKGFQGTDSLGRNVNQAERPYLRRALRENSAEIKRRLNQP